MSKTSKNNAAVTISHVTFRYPNRTAAVLQDISLSVPAGTRLAVLGASGSGKSTLLRIIARLLVPQDGNVQVLGHVAMVQQDPAVQVVGSTVHEDVLFGPRNQALTTQVCRQQCQQALHAVGAWQLADRPICELSVGELQRVALAGALAANPDILLLDEPFAHLDAVGKSEMSSLIERLCDQGMTVVEVTHSLRSCRQADLVALLHNGALLSVDRPTKVLANVDMLQMAGVLPTTRKPLSVHTPPAHAVANEVIATLGPPFLPTTLQLTSGSCTAIVGRSGSGKTRLALSLLGISLTGESAVNPPQGVCLNAAHPSILFQQPERYFWGNSVGDELYAAGLSHHSSVQPVAAFLPQLGLPPDFQDRSLSSLSEGELRRAALAISMAGNPDLLIADEPFTGLDLPAKHRVETMLSAYVQAGGCLLLITTERQALRRLASQCVVLQEGEAVHVGTMHGVMADPALAALAGVAAPVDASVCTNTPGLRSHNNPMAAKATRHLSLLECIDPRSKLLMLFVGLITLFATPPPGTAIIFIWALLAWSATGARRSAAFAYRSILVLCVVTVGTHAIWGAPPYDVHIAGLHISRPGTMRGLLLAARLMTMAIAANALTAATSPLALAGALQWLFFPFRRLGITPPDLPMLLAISTRFIPEVQADARRLDILRRLRRASVSGNTAHHKRLRGNRNLVQVGRELLIPLLRLALRRANALGDSLALRGYRPGKELTLPQYALNRAELITWLVTGVLLASAWLIA